jgi:hypothetical protein
MATKIDLKRTSVPSKVPTTSSLNLGEIAINTYDGRVFIKKDDGVQSIVEIGGGGSSGVNQILTGSGVTISPSSGTGIVTISATGGSGSPGGSTTQIQYNNAGTFAGVPTLTYSGSLLRATGSFTGSFTGSLQGTSSYALTASYALNAGGGTGTGFPFSGSAIITGSMLISGSGLTVTGSINVTQGITGSLLGTASYATTASYALNAGAGSGFPFSGSGVITGSLLISGSGLIVTGSISSTGGFTGSLQGTSSWASNAVTASYIATASWANNALTASYVNPLTQTVIITGSLISSGSNTFIGSQTVTGSLSTSGSNTLIGNTVLSGSIGISGSSTIQGTTTMTGSLNITGSTTQIGSNTLIGNTLLSGSIIISGSSTPGSPTASVQIYGDIRQSGYHRFDPVTTNIDTSISASYIYVSGSTQDMYFSQNGSGKNNVTRLRWLEGGALYTGLLRGGIISSTPGTTTFKITSGSGLLVTMNASTASEPYPTVQYISWPEYSAQPIINSGSAKITYVGIDSNGQIIQQIVPWGTNDINQWDNSISLGVVLHLSGSVSTGVFNAPQISYGGQQKADDFFRAFGPLKVSGHTLQASGSTLGLTKLAGTSYREGANYIINANHPSTVVENSINTSKIYRYYLSGSIPVINTGDGNAGYTGIDPTQRVDTTTGALTSVSTNKYSLQRVFWVPNSPTNAFIVYYGNAQYDSLIDAVNAKDSEPFSEAPNTSQNAIFLGYIAVAGGAADLTNTSDATIVQGGLFRNVGGVGSGGGTNYVSTTLAGLADVSLSPNPPNNNQLLAYNTSISKWQNVSSITASLQGTSSWANNALTASYAATASYALNVNGPGFNVTASFLTSSTWTINHNLGQRYVLVQAYDYDWNQIIPQTITLTDSNTTTISFATTESGYAIATIGGGTIISQSITYQINNTASALFATTGSNNFTGNQIITGSLTATQGITGSLFGTASYVTGSIFTNGNSALSASYALTASYALNAGGGTGTGFPFSGSGVITGSLLISGSGLIVTGSVSISGSLNATSSWANNALTSSYVTGSVYNSTNPALSASYALTASYALNAGGGGSGFPFSGSGVITGSLLISGSPAGQGLIISGTLNVTQGITGSLFGTASYVTGSIFTSTNPALSASYAAFATSASYASGSTSASYASTSSFLPIGTYTITSSWTNNYTETDPVYTIEKSKYLTTGSSGGTQTISGSLVINQNLTVLGTSSITYVTSSQLNISTNIITVNTATPAIRFGGLAVADSGSSPIRSGSLLFDSTNDQWIFVHQSSSSGGAITSSILIMGPESTTGLGNEINLTTNRIPKSVNAEHIGDSNISDDGTTVLINSNTQITGSLLITGSLILTGSLNSPNITGSLQGTSSWASWATNALTASTADSFTVRNNLIVSGNMTFGDATTDNITMNAATMSLGSGTGILNIDSNTLYVDGANNRVGINTTNPNSRLDINNGTINVSINNNDPALRVSASNTGLTNIEIINLSTDTNAGSALRFANNIGLTGNPQAQIFLGSSNYTSGGNRFFIQNITGSVEVTSTTGNVDINTSAVGVANTRLRVFNNGNVAIGTNPSDTGFELNINEPSISGSLRVSGSSVMTGSLTVTQGVTASLQGTSSWATNAVTALNGGVTQVNGSPSITVTPGAGGSVTISVSSNVSATLGTQLAYALGISNLF